MVNKMSTKFSIIIPTYKHLEDCLKPCIESIIKFTDLSNIEVIVAANGCGNDGTREYVESLGYPFKLLWIEEQLGYTISTGMGIESAVGEYVVLFNNDCELLPQPKNQWLQILQEPFLKNKMTAVSGPMLAFCTQAQMDFLIGFCICIKKSLFEEIAVYYNDKQGISKKEYDTLSQEDKNKFKKYYLDPVFAPAYSEDTDACVKLVNLGYEIVQVCPSKEYYGPNQMSGQFPIFHKGNVSYKKWIGGEELLRKNNQILHDRYNPLNITIDRALTCDGYMNTYELKWLAEHAKNYKKIVEVGSWHGKSSRAIADNLPENGVLYCVDTWNGSKAEDFNHGSAKWMDGDHAYYQFLQNNIDLIQSGKLIPLRMTSENASNFFKEKNIKFDMIFLDADHTYEACKKDIELWKDIITDDGLFCGHDYGGWIGVDQAVEEKISNFKVDKHCTIWYCGKNDINLPRPNIFDCFPYNGENEVLEIRFNELYDVVDRFVIVESTRTHQNKSKELQFEKNLKRFEKFLNKITYLVVEDFPAFDSWSIERHQRDGIMRGLSNCKDSDIIMISDCDEIPNAKAVKTYRLEDGIKSFEQKLHYYNFNCQAEDPWKEAKILSYGLLKQISPCGARYAQCGSVPNGGWHFSYFSDIDGIIKKIGETAHIEYSTPEFTNREKIDKAVKECSDLYGRNLKYKHVEIDETYPKYVLENMYKFRHFIKSKESQIDSLYKYQCENKHTDIFEHLPTLLRYSEECEYITEFGVRDVASTWAFLKSRPKRLTSYDIYRSPSIDWVNDICKNEGVNFDFIQSSTLEVEIEKTDLLFIDTLHIYQQLKGELSKHSDKVKKYIIMHDTVTFGEYGEVNGSIGLMPALNEFLASNPQWKIREVYTNLHGLTVLERVA